MEEVEVEVDPRVRRLLLRADELLETYGWRQVSFGDRETGFCLVGAVREAGRRGPLLLHRRNLKLELRALEVLRECAELRGFRGQLGHSGPYWGLTRWNDRAGRTVDQVRGLLRATAEGQCGEER